VNEEPTDATAEEEEQKKSSIPKIEGYPVKVIYCKC